MRTRRISAYAGVDPTAPSLHLGHLLAFMPLFWMYLHGYGALTLIGATTAKVGDPTGRTTSRPELSRSDLIQNMATIHHQLKAIWDNVDAAGRRHGYQREWAWKRGIVNNTVWWNKQSMLEVLQRLGSHMRLGPMLGRDNVKTRLEDGSGMSFSEFCYPLMQAWDWCRLLEQHNVQMQIGGSDQYGNILTGVQCVKAFVDSEPNPDFKRPSGELDQPIGLTVPLLTDSSGAKFGKSAGNAVWLDPFKTSSYDLYGYLVRRSDEEVGKLLKLFTFFPQSQIDSVMAEHMQDPPKRVAQHLLAFEVSRLVHGDRTAKETQLQHRSVYGRNTTPTTPDAEQQLSDYNTPHRGCTTSTNRPRADMKLPQHLLQSTLPRIVWASGLATSASDASRMIKAGGIYLGGAPGQYGEAQTGMNPLQLSFTPAKTWSYDVNMKFLIDGKLLLLRKGKHNLRVIEFISDEEFSNSGLTYHGQPNTGAFRTAMKALQLAKKEAKESKADGDEEASVDMEKLMIHESVMRSPRFRHEKEKLVKDGLLKDDGW